MSPAPAVAPATAALRPQMYRVFDVAIAPDPVRVAGIRRITAAFMRYWAVPAELADDMVLVVSELVTNSVEHGTGTISLRLRHSGSGLYIEVTDGSSTPARLGAPGTDAEHGRGLLLVSALAQDWGVSGDGQTTWATVRVPGGRS
ncbi:ATP-binding protein [Streptomyces sp. NPDC004752]